MGPKVPNCDQRDWYAAREIAKLAGVSDQAVYNAARRESLPVRAVRIHTRNSWQFPKASIDRLSPAELKATIYVTKTRSTPPITKATDSEVQELRDQLAELRLKWALAEQRVDVLTNESTRLREVIDKLQDTIHAATSDWTGVDRPR
jgi:hypothetical protein